MAGCMDASGLGGVDERATDHQRWACGSLIILFSSIRRRNWHARLEMGVFRKMVLPGLVVYGVSHRCAEWLRASASDEQPHGPSPLHGSVSHWPLTLSTSLLPFVNHHLDGLGYRLLMDCCTLRNTSTVQFCAVKRLILRALYVTGMDLRAISDSAAPQRGIPCLLSELHHIPPGSRSSA